MRVGEWGCSCGRLCASEDENCEACDGPRSAGVLFGSDTERARFLKRAEIRDGRAIFGAERVLLSHQALLDGDAELSYAAAGGELDAHSRAIYGDLLRYLEPESGGWIPF